MSDQQLGSGRWLHEATIRVHKELKGFGQHESRLYWAGKDLWVTLPGGERKITEYASKLTPLEEVDPLGY